MSKHDQFRQGRRYVVVLFFDDPFMSYNLVNSKTTVAKDVCTCFSILKFWNMLQGNHYMLKRFSMSNVPQMIHYCHIR